MNMILGGKLLSAKDNPDNKITDEINIKVISHIFIR